jgi:hypothetical protein
MADRILFASLALGIGLATGATPAAADNISERLAKMPSASLTSSKSLAALEFCIGLGIAEWMEPQTLHGEGVVLIAGNPNIDNRHLVYMLVKVEEKGEQRAIAIHAHKAWDDRTTELVRSCL